MEIHVPGLLNDQELREERINVIRQVSRLTVYLGVLNDEISERTTYLDADAVVVPIRNREM